MLHDYLEILRDPAHVAVEFTFVLIDYLIIQTVATRLKRHFHRDIAREHAKIDAEVGVVHAPKTYQFFLERP